MGISVLLADDQQTIRHGLRLRLGLEPDITVVGEAADGEEAVELAIRLRPDVVVMDCIMPNLDGIGATRELRRRASSIEIVMLSLHDDASTRDRALVAGATSFVPKHNADRFLIDAIRDAARRQNQPAEGREERPP